MSAALEISGVVKRYAGDAVLDGLDLVIPEGESVGLIGINGAGKTTLIKCLLDLAAVDAGRIRVFGVDHREPRARAPLAYLAEHFLPPHYVTGEELLRCACHLHGRAYDRDRARAEAVQLHFDPVALSRRVRTYSKGMAQKLGLIACLLAQCPLLVLDEPMSGLDPTARAVFRRRLVEIKQAGATVFFSTHLLSDVEQICDRIAVLHAGAVQYCGGIAAFVASRHAADLESAYLDCVSVPRPAA